MAVRETLRPIKAIFDGAARAIRGEHNVLTNEMEELKTNYAALLAKLDADAGVTDTDYASTLGNSGSEAKLVVPR